MCVIIYHQRKHKTIDLESLQNAIHNNPHGVGIVRFGKKSQLLVEKFVPKDTENGPNAEELHKKLKSFEAFSYALHLRNTTAGGNTTENLHPFNLVQDKKTEQHIEFMHNGTLSDFVDRQSDESDTKRFVDTVLRPLTEMHVAAYGSSCVTLNKTLRIILENYRNQTSRFLLISGHRTAVRLGNWIEKDFGFVSNDDYFKEVVRGPHKKKTLSAVSYNNWGSGGSNRVFGSTTEELDRKIPFSTTTDVFFNRPYAQTKTFKKEEFTSNPTFFG
jgi:predicted glutamine amidotransferase